jgi:two-component system response regulator EvgA
MKILIAEDSDLIAKRLVDLVSAVDNVSVLNPALDGVEAMRLFREHSPDVVIIDLQLPKATGLEVVEAIRRENSKCLVIILTGRIDFFLRDRCISAGANYFLSKVFDFGLIPKLIKSL